MKISEIARAHNISEAKFERWLEDSGVEVKTGFFGGSVDDNLDAQELVNGFQNYALQKENSKRVKEYSNRLNSSREFAIKVVTVAVLPHNARYKLIDSVAFRSTLGTGFLSEFGSDVSNILGTEANMLNNKMATSHAKVVDMMRKLAYELGANAVIGASFEYTTNTRDATTVSGAGTAVLIENIDDVFHDIIAASIATD